MIIMIIIMTLPAILGSALVPEQEREEGETFFWRTSRRIGRTFSELFFTVRF